MRVAGTESTIYRERVYCYELYHRWRQHWPDGFRYSLCGETDKRNHALIVETHIKDSISDFLVHVPGEMDNLLVMEVKAADRKINEVHNGKNRGMIKDLEKLTAFRKSLKDEHGHKADYQKAILWLFGKRENGWGNFAKEIQNEAQTNVHIDLKQIDCYVHEGPGLPGWLLKW